LKLPLLITKFFDGSIIKFKDRQNASELLCSILRNKLSKLSDNEFLVLGIPRGGIIIGDIIAKKFGYKFDIVIPKKIVSPSNGELSIGAIMKDNTTYFNTILINTIEITDDYLHLEKENKLKEIEVNERLLGQQINGEQIKGKNIILVDDGVATGSTLIVTSRWIKKYEPASLTILVPVCPKPVLGLLKKEADYVESISTPSLKNFITVEKFYQNFEQLEINSLNNILKKYKT
jgi:predicted phosphoribosyltransferase